MSMKYMTLSPRLGLLLAGALLALGCSGEQPGDGAEASDRSFGLVAVEFTHDVDALTATAPESVEVTTTAQFVRFAAIDRDRVARLLALPLHPRHDLPELDTCQVYEQAPVLSETETDGEGGGYVDLLEAGELEIDAGTERLALEPRYFPGLLPFISGVVYGEAQTSRTQQAGQVLARASGSDAVGSFQVAGMTPDPLLARPEFDAMTAGSRATAPLELRWNPATTGDSNAAAYVAIGDGSKVSERVLRCRVVDDGSFAVERQLLDEIIGPGTEQLAIEGGRIRQVDFSARGLDGAELRVSSTGRTSLDLP
jgi:hypothetical protein